MGSEFISDIAYRLAMASQHRCTIQKTKECTAIFKMLIDNPQETSRLGETTMLSIQKKLIEFSSIGPLFISFYNSLSGYFKQKRAGGLDVEYIEGYGYHIKGTFRYEYEEHEETSHEQEGVCQNQQGPQEPMSRDWGVEGGAGLDNFPREPVPEGSTWVDRLRIARISNVEGRFHIEF
jgi:hypothetical protein